MNKKSICALAALSLSAFLLNGCFMPKAHSMGASLMNVSHQPRLSADSENAEFTASVNAFGGISGEGLNVEDVKSGGANASLMFRMGGSLSPLFFSAAVGGFGGKLGFTCSESGCSDNSLGYKAWLKTKDGKDEYSFWNVQERLVVGGDFNPGKYLILGLGGGVQFFQGGGDYDDKREDLDKLGLIESLDDNYGVAPVSSVWLGSRLGQNGKWGSVLAEFDMLYKGGSDVWTSSIMLNYFHTSGFFGGVIWNSQLGYELNVGKTFVF